jgi:type IV pilus biogenesis protein CpaD/CtpE
MRDPRKTLLSLAVLAGVAALASGCVDTKTQNAEFNDADNFGHAVREDLVAQIVNPDPAYTGPPPPYSGTRTAMGQTAYRSDAVKAPTAISTSSVSGGGGN